ncbi:hypothetical protein D7V32_09470 [Acinetobacter tianfuensis]|uniref:Uncharacterized protein n=2 Tax=Acinetobacter tianfuensis TaxID=2419603 RepID=A0A3A8ERR4_9GAMM|nr:hypothetical protein D7V32_09470 [Acinetobacter tianfuensis]
MKPFMAAALIGSIFLVGCVEDNTPAQALNPELYSVQNASQLQQKIADLNVKLADDYMQMKQMYGYAFSNTFALNADDLKTLNAQAVSATALKPVKEHYCSMMNGYFNELYRYGHFNQNLMDDVVLNNASAVGLADHFKNAASFYQFVMEEHSTYKQAQQLMGFGCNLRGALSPV